ncbi:cleft lip and palate transmembrane protein 1-domain-containing protein [Pilobolus umbonatus]|nr:cleft lip and palate transmembrane protein 1-domain-containing protein [Pilobolus umbonatus]
MAEDTKGSPSAPANEEQSFYQKHKGTLMRMVFFWLFMKVFTAALTPNTPAVTPTVNTPTSTETTYTPGHSVLRDYAVVPEDIYYFPHPTIPIEELPDNFVPLWKAGTPVDVSVYVSEDAYFTDYSRQPDWKATDIEYGTQFEPIEHDIEITATKTMQHNGTVYAHLFVTQKNRSIHPKDKGFLPDSVVYYRHVLTKFYPQKAIIKQKNLLKGGEEEEEEEHMKEEEHKEEDVNGGGILGSLGRRAPLVAYWHPNVTISLLANGDSVFAKTSLPPPIMKYIQLDTQLSRDVTGKVGFYKPVVFPNEFWILQQNAYPVNESVTTLPLVIRLEPISLWKFNIFATLDDSMKQQASNPLGGMSASDIDEVKRMFLETNPVLLGTTIAVSLLHSLFEMLAFKNDIAFWNKKSNSVGVSVRTLIVNIFFQIVIFLYLLDNNQETSWMVLISQGFGLLIEFWKVFKALKYELIWTPGSLIPSLGHQQVESTKEEDTTAEYDAIAFKYLKWLSYPLLTAYAVYSLYYDEHKSWYSYVLKTLVEFVYMFGFITMLPQLYINYRLKSVAHMPWKTLMYKSLNTFIDDLFAFVIKMPTLHRLACLRDDFVFFVYIYQRYAYKTDPTRANEYGQVGATEEEEKEKEVKKNQ